MGPQLLVNAFLVVLALVMFLLAALNVPTLPRANWGWLGMFFLTLGFAVRLVP